MSGAPRLQVTSLRRGFLRCSFGVLLSASWLGCSRAQPAARAAEDRLVVFAASSLRDVFTALGQRFEGERPGVTLSFNFAGTQELRTQLEHGAAADVFASADPRQLDELLRAGRVEAPEVFAQNELVLVVSAERAGELTTLGDLPSAARVVLGAEQVPVGGYTLQLLERANARFGADFRARVEARVVSRELNVRQVLTKVRLGEAEAGIVYRSDALGAGAELGVVAIPPELNVVADYPIAIVRGAPHPVLARAWLELVRSEEGRRALQSAGFRVPGSAP